METLGRRAAFLLPLSLANCRRTPTPESVSEAFMDRYYVERKPSEALALTVDLAQQRVEDEKALLAQAGAAGPGVQPRVFYKHIQTEKKDNLTQLSYRLTVDGGGGAEIKKRIRIDVVPVGNDFKVAFFNEQDAAE